MPTHPTNVANAFLNSLTTIIDAAGAAANAKIDFRTGAAPGATNVLTGTQLALLNLPVPPSFPAASARAMVMNGLPLSTTVLATGSMGYGRIIDRGALSVQEFSIATAAADCNFAGGVAVVLGGTITLTGWTENAPL